MTEDGTEVTKDTKLRHGYPALAATGATSLIAVLSVLVWAVPYFELGATHFAGWLLATAERTAGFFPV